jgi:hypothetical protein
VFVPLDVELVMLAEQLERMDLARQLEPNPANLASVLVRPSMKSSTVTSISAAVCSGLSWSTAATGSPQAKKARMKSAMLARAILVSSTRTSFALITATCAAASASSYTVYFDPDRIH